MAEDNTQIETANQVFGDWSRGEMHMTLRERRSKITAHLEGQSRTPVLSELVFDLLVHLALNAETELDTDLVDSFAWRYELEPTEASLQMPNGRRADLATVLTGEQTSESIEVINALAPMGFSTKLQP